jgi:phytoene/squalene synthetase
MKRAFVSNKSVALHFTTREQRKFFTTAANETAQEALKQAFRFSAMTLRQNDYETYICTNAIDAKRRASAIAIRALNAETASVASATSEKVVAIAKLRWWFDQVEDMFSSSIEEEEEEDDDDNFDRLKEKKKRVKKTALVDMHPIGRCVNACARHLREIGGENNDSNNRNNSKRWEIWTKKAIECRIKDVENEQKHLRMEDLERFARETHGNFLLLLLDMENIKSVASDHVASHLGTAIGITNSLRGARVHSRNRRTYFPEELLSAENISQEMIYKGEIGNEKVKNISHKIASTAIGHLNAARKTFRDNDLGTKHPHMAKILLQATTIERWLQKLEAYDFDVFREELGKTPPLLTQGRVFISAWKNTF